MAALHMVTTLTSCSPYNATRTLVSNKNSYQNAKVQKLRAPTKEFPFSGVQVCGAQHTNFNKSNNVNNVNVKKTCSQVSPSQHQQGAVLGPDGEPYAQGMSRREALLTSGAVGLSLVSPIFLPQVAEAGEEKSVYDFTVKYKDEDTSLQQYKGMNYPGLRYLWNKYRDQGFTLLAFPCNQFGGQAPGSSDEEREYAYYKFGFEFPVFDKLEVKGPTMHPLYGFLKKRQSGEIEWNYVKFLIDRNGNPIRRYKPAFDPINFEKDVVAALDGKPLPVKERTYLGAP